MLRIAASSCSGKVQPPQQRFIFQKASAVHIGGPLLSNHKKEEENDNNNSTYTRVVSSQQRRHLSVAGGGASMIIGSSSSTMMTMNNNGSSPPILMSRRNMSTSNAETAAAATPNPTFQETMSNLIPSPSKPIPSEEEVAANLAARAAEAWDPTWYNPADQAVNAINYIHDITSLPYSLTIVGLTFGVRTLLFPLFVKSQQNVARMAHMRPEMDVLKTKIEKLGSNIDQETQMKHGMEMKALFQKYQCNPLKSLMLPIVQAPVFMSMFFGLRKMPEYFPNELANGGMLWFPDLAAADPYYAMPILSAGSFLLMIELGKDQMMASNPDQGKLMMTFFRCLAVVIVPATMNFPTAVFCYWTTNNLFSLVQSIAFRNKAVRKALDIWDPPKPVPGMTSAEDNKGIVESLKDSFKKSAEKQDKVSVADQIKKHNEMIEQRKMERKAGGKRKRGGQRGGK